MSSQVSSEISIGEVSIGEVPIGEDPTSRMRFQNATGSFVCCRNSRVLRLTERATAFLNMNGLVGGYKVFALCRAGVCGAWLGNSFGGLLGCGVCGANLFLRKL